jgi:hypothetical protein
MDIRVSTLKKERAISRRFSMERVSGCIADWVGFSFDYAPS